MSNNNVNVTPVTPAAAAEGTHDPFVICNRVLADPAVVAAQEATVAHHKAWTWNEAAQAQEAREAASRELRDAVRLAAQRELKGITLQDALLVVPQLPERPAGDNRVGADVLHLLGAAAPLPSGPSGIETREVFRQEAERVLHGLVNQAVTLAGHLAREGKLGAVSALEIGRLGAQAGEYYGSPDGWGETSWAPLGGLLREVKAALEAAGGSPMWALYFAGVGPRPCTCGNEVPWAQCPGNENGCCG